MEISLDEAFTLVFLMLFMNVNFVKCVAKAAGFGRFCGKTMMAHDH